MAKREGAASVVISAAIEAEVASLADPAEKRAFLESLDLTETGLARVIRAGYQLLHLITFFTVGPKEARAWTVRRDAKAPAAAAHSAVQGKGVSDQFADGGSRALNKTH